MPPITEQLTPEIPPVIPPATESAPVATGVGDPVMNRLDFLTIITYAVLIVLFVGFAGMFVATTAMLVDAFNNKAASYQELSNKINALNQSCAITPKTK